MSAVDVLCIVSRVSVSFKEVFLDLCPSTPLVETFTKAPGSIFTPFQYVLSAYLV